MKYIKKYNESWDEWLQGKEEEPSNRLYNPNLWNPQTPQEFTMASQLVSWLDENFPELRMYRNEDAEYDDMWYQIPYDTFNRVTGLTGFDIDQINNNFEDYEGSIYLQEDTVTIHGGA